MGNSSPIGHNKRLTTLQIHTRNLERKTFCSFHLTTVILCLTKTSFLWYALQWSLVNFETLAPTIASLRDIHSSSKSKHNATMKLFHHKNQLSNATPLNYKHQRYLTCKQTKKQLNAKKNTRHGTFDVHKLFIMNNCSVIWNLLPITHHKLGLPLSIHAHPSTCTKNSWYRFYFTPPLGSATASARS
jgi:hypothetical protein